jgi:hypothetical protein
LKKEIIMTFDSLPRNDQISNKRTSPFFHPNLTQQTTVAGSIASKQATKDCPIINYNDLIDRPNEILPNLLKGRSGPVTLQVNLPDGPNVGIFQGYRRTEFRVKITNSLDSAKRVAYQQTLEEHNLVRRWRKAYDSFSLIVEVTPKCFVVFEVSAQRRKANLLRSDPNFNWPEANHGVMSEVAKMMVLKRPGNEDKFSTKTTLQQYVNAGKIISVIVSGTKTNPLPETFPKK